MADRNSERLLHYAPKFWWMVSNWGIPHRVFVRRREAIEYAKYAAGGRDWKSIFEIRKVTVSEVADGK